MADVAISIDQWADFYNVFGEFIVRAWIGNIGLDYDFRVKLTDTGYEIYGDDKATHSYPPNTLIQVKCVNVDDNLKKLQVLKMNIDNFKTMS